MGKEPEGQLISLLDEEGHEHEFEHLATVEYQDSSYVGLLPVNEEPEQMLEGDGELVVLKIVADEETGEDVLVSIEDEEEFRAVSQEFEKLLEEEYEIHEDDEL
ncbi:MAG TPA: DUF1292 domain-containing protein [Ruminococcaceae bacterium]|nr:DUF1292 domain-containing protein [Oscillospiraceae bacterium]